MYGLNILALANRISHIIGSPLGWSCFLQRIHSTNVYFCFSTTPRAEPRVSLRGSSIPITDIGRGKPYQNRGYRKCPGHVP